MKRFATFIGLTILAGCLGVPSSPPVAEAFADGWAYATAGRVLFRRAAPQPQPQPAPGGVCPNCKGTGKLPGDGVIKPECPECGGTGKVKVSVLKAPSKPAPAFIDNAGSCSTGTCGAPQTRSYAPARRLWRR